MKKNLLIILFLIYSTLICEAQLSVNKEHLQHFQNQGPNNFPELVYTDIPGAPKLSKPVLIMGGVQPLMGEGMGWAAPATYDWNGDGRKDLLIGEYASGLENGQEIGNFIRVYLNIGSDDNPQFTDVFKYATPIFGIGNGTPFSIFTWCCMEFRPQFIDLDNDGYTDLVAGQYNPGEIMWFRGNKKGFLPGEQIEQEGSASSANQTLPVTDIRSLWYWNYSSVSFGDFDEDGDLDMIVGGAALRISKNIGSKNKPKFGYRELLLDTAGNPLTVRTSNINDSISISPSENWVAGTYCAVPEVVDWDNDGVLDLLVTNGYYERGYSAITFFRGRKTKEGHRFEKGKPLFFVKGLGKAFPGSWLRTFVTDWNNDGVNDLLVGTSIVTIDQIYHHKLSWTWEKEAGILKKNPGLPSFGNRAEELIQIAKKNEETLGKDEMKRRNYLMVDRIIKDFYGKEEYKSLVHKGYIYLMLGKIN